MYKDLREFIELVDKLGALRHIDGADLRFEIGAITEVAAGRSDGPALLFDAIKGFPRGFRIFTNATTSPQRAALALGIDPALRPLDALKAWMEKRKTLQPRAPLAIKDAAFLQHTVTGKDVDLAKFPAPIWHRHDGGAFLGSGSIVIMRDPDGGWINASIYRVQVHGRDKVTVQLHAIDRGVDPAAVRIAHDHDRARAEEGAAVVPMPDRRRKLGEVDVLAGNRVLQKGGVLDREGRARLQRLALFHPRLERVERPQGRVDPKR